MHIIDATILIISLALEIWLIALLLRQRVYDHFPVFFAFTLFTAAIAVARLATIANYRRYFFVYWWTEAAFALLSLAALHEVFHWMFEGFYRLWWFRLCYYGTILAALGVAAYNALVSPPTQAHPFISLILEISIAVNFVRMGIVSLFVVSQRILVIEFRRYAYGIVIGFAISSAGPLLGYLARSGIGTKLETFAKYSPAVGYILGVAIWVASFIRPEPEDKWEPPMSPERMMEEVQGYLGAIGITKKRQ